MNRRSILVSIVTLMLLIPLKAAVADIFQYTDDDGVIHFSNVSVGNSKKYRKVKRESATARSTGQNSYAAPPPSLR